MGCECSYRSKLARLIHHQHLNRRLALIQHFTYLRKALCPRRISRLAAAVEQVEDLLIARLAQEFDHLLLGRFLCLCNSDGYSRFGIGLGHSINRIRNRRPIKHETRLQRHQAGCTTGQTRVFLLQHITALRAG